MSGLQKLFQKTIIFESFNASSCKD